MKSAFKITSSFFLIKYLVFYTFMMFKNQNFYILNISNFKSLENIIYYLFIFLLLPFILIFIFTLPVYFSLKIKNSFFYFFMFFLFLVLEYFIYVYFNSEKVLDKNGFYNSVISVVIFTFMSWYRVQSKYSSKH